MKKVVAGFVLALVLTGCTAEALPGATNSPSSSPSGSSVEDKAAARESAKAAKAAEAKAACKPVDKAMLNAIAEGADAVAITPLRGAAVKSDDLENAYLIAMEFDAPGGDSVVGVWTSGSLKAGDALLMSVDGFAKSFTKWPDAGKSKFNITQSVHGFAESIACLN